MELLNISIVFMLVTILFLLIVGFVVVLIHRFTDLYLYEMAEHLGAIIIYLFIILFVLALMRIALVLL